jgi:hypothetical protein
VDQRQRNAIFTRELEQGYTTLGRATAVNNPQRGGKKVKTVVGIATLERTEALARAAILLASAALVYVGGRAAQRVIGCD